MNLLNISSIVVIFLLNLSGFSSAEKCEKNTYFEDEADGIMRIPFMRQKTPLEQQLNSPLRKYGIKMDWLYQDFEFKPKPKPHNVTNDSIAIYRFLDHEFYAPVVIGHPGQTVNLAFDTTWSRTWVISSYCNGLPDIGCYFHNKYNHKHSSEYKPDGRPFSVNEGSYNLTGFYSYDNISFAHSNVTNFSFVEMVEVPKTFIFNKADGVMGLGLKTSDYEPFFYTLVRQKKIKNNTFSVYYNRDHSMDHNSIKAGNILLGGYDKRHFKCSVVDGKKVYDKETKIDVDDISYWQFQMDRIILAYDRNTPNITLCANGCKAIIDTSSSAIIGPPDEIDKIHRTIDARKLIFGRYSVKCDTIPKLPKITFQIGSTNFTLSGEQYVTKLTWDSVIICLSTFKPAETPDEKIRWILGASFLSEVYTIYYVGEKKIGLVRAA